VTATNAGGSSSAQAKVYMKPGAVRTCKLFYFRLTNPQFASLSCFYQSYCAVDEATAKAAVAHQFPDYTATEVDANTFTNVPCTN
jgi:hypothetical protein